MPIFSHNGFDIAYIDERPDEWNGETVLLIHGFASTYRINWIGPGWVKTLTGEGYRAVAFDHRGHGETSKSYQEDDYTPTLMASDAVALLDHLEIGTAHVFGYSMGARVAAFMARDHGERVASLILGGLGYGMIEGVGEWDIIADALRADDPASVTHPRGKMFRAFADQTRSDREALAACIARSRELLSEADAGRIAHPALVAVGTRDDIAGSAEGLARLIPNGEAFDIPGRDHMLSVGDRAFKEKAVTFLKDNPIS